jgi:hypothetical protein
MPIPPDHSLAALRTKFDRAISKAERIKHESEAPYLDLALKYREALDGLVSTSSQVEDYRARFGAAWSDSFTPLQTFAKQAFFGLEGPALVNHLWRSLPNTRFKRFQELFCEPSDYAIPKPNLVAPCVQYPSRHNLNTCSLASCLVSPPRIPFKLLVDLGIVPEPKRKLTDIEILTIKSHPMVIQTLKAIWESAQPLAGNNHRFIVVAPLQDVALRNNPEAGALPESVLGTLLHTRENVAVDRSKAESKRGPWVAPQLIPSFYSSIYAARRKTDHQTSSHQRESVSIGNLAVEWNELTTRAREQWRRDAPVEVKQAIRDALVDLVARTRVQLESVSHHLKRQAAERFKALEDRLKSGSNNITTHITAANAAVTRLEDRLSDVPFKSGHNTVDSAQLSRMIEGGEHAFDMIRNSLFQASCRLRDQMTRNDGFFNQRGLSEAERTAHANILLSRMGIRVDALNQVPAVRPLRAFEIAHRATYTELRNAVLDQNAQQASEAMVKLVVFSKLQRADAIFEVLRSLTGRSKAVPLKELRRHATSLRNLLDLRSVFPQTTVPAYQPTYRKLQRTVGTIVGGLERYDRRGMDLDERTQMYSRLRAYLDKTDLEACVLELLALKEDPSRAGGGSTTGA